MLLYRMFAVTAIAVLAARADDKPLSPVEARKKIGEKITVEMTVQTTKDRLENRGEIYLDAELDFKDEKNFAVVITKTGAAKLKEAGIDDPAAHFKDKKIRASGVVKEVDQVPRIEIDDAKQIQIVQEKCASSANRLRQLPGWSSFTRQLTQPVRRGWAGNRSVPPVAGWSCEGLPLTTPSG
jgi:hypothetical protein